MSLLATYKKSKTGRRHCQWSGALRDRIASEPFSGTQREGDERALKSSRQLSE